MPFSLPVTSVARSDERSERVSGGDSENEEWSDELNYHEYIVASLLATSYLLLFHFFSPLPLLPGGSLYVLQALALVVVVGALGLFDLLDLGKDGGEDGGVYEVFDGCDERSEERRAEERSDELV